MIGRDQDEELPGGLLCDDQGLGKTLQALSLIASRLEPPSHVGCLTQQGRLGWLLYALL